MQQHGQPQQQLGLAGVHGVKGMLPHVVNMMRILLIKIEHGRQLGQNDGKNLPFFPQYPRRVPSSQQLAQLVLNALGRHGAQKLPLLRERGGGRFLHAKAEAGCKAQRPQDPQRVLFKPGGGIAYGPQKAVFQIVPSAEGILKSLVGAIGHGVHRQIPPGQILPQTAGKADAVGPAMVGIVPVDTKGGDLHPHVLRHGGDGAVLQTGIQHGHPGQGLVDLLRQGVGGHVPVVGHFSKQAVADTPAHGIGPVARIAKAAKQPIHRCGKRELPFAIHSITSFQKTRQSICRVP